MTAKHERLTPDGKGKQKCQHCQHKSVKGLIRGEGLCPYHWAVYQWGQEWADRCYPRKLDE